MLSIAQQMLQESRTKIELLRMQIIKVSQSRNGESQAGDGTFCTHTPAPLRSTAHARSPTRSDGGAELSSGTAAGGAHAPHED